MVDLTEINNIVNNSKNGLKEIQRGKDSDVRIWQTWYKGFVPTFHRYYQWNGIKKNYLTKKSMQGARLISKEWSTLIMNEKVKVGVEDDKQSELLNIMLKKLKFRTKVSIALEQGFALSNAAVAIDLEKISTSQDEPDENGYFSIDSCRPVLSNFNAWNTVPLEIVDGTYTQVAFVKTVNGNKRYILHLQNDKGLYDIAIVDEIRGRKKNRVYYIELNSPYKLFTIFHPNEANNLREDGKGYISVFANAIPELEALDTAYDSLHNEVKLGKKRIYISAKLSKYNKDTNQEEPTFDPNDVVINVLPNDNFIDGKSTSLIQDTTTELRIESLVQAVSFHLNILAKQCGLGSKFFKMDNQGFATATQVISENSDTYNNLKKHEIIVQTNIEDICKAAMFISNELQDGKYDLDQEVNVEFNDSIVQDKDSEKASDMNDANNGVMSKVEYRMKWYNESEETATEKIRKYFGNEELSNRLSKFAPLYSAGLIPTEIFVDLVYIDSTPEDKVKIVEFIESSKTSGDYNDIVAMNADGDGESDSDDIFKSE